MNNKLSQLFKAWLLCLSLSFCTQVYSYDFKVGNLYYEIIDGTNEVYIFPQNGAVQMNYNGDVAIPSTVTYSGKNYTVVGIGEYAFAMSSITSIQLPSTIRFISNNVFDGCSKLSALQLPNSLDSIGGYFINGSAITNLAVPTSVTKIAKRAFAGSSLESVDLSNLSNSITEISEGLFYGCRNLNSIVIPNNITTIEKNSFLQCDKLSSVTLSNSLTTIKSSAFYNCSSLESITLPSTLTSIESYAFTGCSKLKEVDSKIKTPFNVSCFTSVPNDSKLYVPVGTKSKYEALSGWTVFSSIIEKPNIYNLTITASGNGTVKYGVVNIKNTTSSFTLSEGSTATISFNPDNGYKVKSLKVNNEDRTSYIYNDNPGAISMYMISNISADTNVEVVFEAKPPTTYSLTITASGNGTATYGNTSIKNKSNSFSLNKGTSATITFTPDDGYRIKNLHINNVDKKAEISNNQYTISSISANTTVNVEFEAIPPTTYTLTITASGNGTATYDNSSIKNNSSSFTLNEGTNATISFTPDDGYRVKSLLVNSVEKKSDISNNQYTISSISANTTVNVEFEAIPPTTYTLTISASGNGTVSYDNTSIKNNSSSFTLNEGTSATITFTPDNGYRIKSLQVNNVDKKADISNNQYTISSITANTTVSVEFEAIPPTTYTLTITASGNGTATYDNTSIKNNSSSFTLNEGTNATITFTSDNGYRIKSLQVNNVDKKADISNNQYTISSIAANTTVSVEFEAIPPTTYTLTIIASGNGTVNYDNTSIKNNSSSFTLNEGTSATITFTPDNGYRIKSLQVNNVDKKADISNNQYTISSITANTTVSVEFEAIPPTTYTLTITASGNGTANYDNTAIKNNSSSFTLNEGTDAKISFTPDN